MVVDAHFQLEEVHLGLAIKLFTFFHKRIYCNRSLAGGTGNCQEPQVIKGGVRKTGLYKHQQRAKLPFYSVSLQDSHIFKYWIFSIGNSHGVMQEHSALH